MAKFKDTIYMDDSGEKKNIKSKNREIAGSR